MAKISIPNEVFQKVLGQPSPNFQCW